MADVESENLKPNFQIKETLIRRRKYVVVKRSAYTYDDIEEKYPRTEEEAKPQRRKFTWSRILPVIHVLKHYDWSNNVWSDTFAGLSVAFLHLPQGLAYGLLASLSPVSGLYTSFFAVSTYILFGTCPHMSMGPNAVLSLVTASMVEREASKMLAEMTTNNSGPALKDVHADDIQDDLVMNYKLGVAQASTFLCGAILLVMGLLRLGFLTSFMPSSFVGGFTTGAAVHIATSQIKHVLHIEIPSHSGAGKILWTYRDLALAFKNTNVSDVMVSIISGTILYLVPMYGNPKIKSRFGCDVPINLIVVILGTLVSYMAGLQQHLGVAIVGTVPVGLPIPRLPDFTAVPNILMDSFALAIITFSMSIAMAMLMAQMHGYEVTSNQELLAYGLCNVTTSFVHSQACSTSPPRTMLVSNSGAKTILHGVPTAIFLLATFLFTGKLFQSLPIPVLAAMILVASKDILMQVRKLPNIWRISKTDFVVWTCTCATTVFADLLHGIIAGVVISAFGIIVNNQNIKGTIIVSSLNEDLFLHGCNRKGVFYPVGIRIFYFPSQLVFSNAENFKAQLYHNVFDPTSVTEMDYLFPEDENESDGHWAMELDTRNSIRCLILDCSAMTYVDLDGVNMLKMVVLHYHQAGVQMLLARCPESTMHMLERASFFTILPRTCVFHDVIDAVMSESQTRYGVSRLSSGMNSVCLLVPPTPSSSSSSSSLSLQTPTTRPPWQ